MLSAAGASAAVNDVITDAASLSNSKVYYLKSARSAKVGSDKYLLYDAANHANFLASTYSAQGSTLALTGNETKFQFAIYTYEGKYYFYNIDGGNFIGNATGNNDAIPMVSVPTSDMQIRFEGVPKDGETTYEGYNALLSTNRSGALNAADATGKHGVVNWKGGYDNKNDLGNCFEIIEAADIPTGLATTIENKIKWAPVVNSAKAVVSGASETIVGAYKTSAVTALSTALTTFDADMTETNYNSVKSAYEALVADASARVTLSAGEKFTLKCIEDNRGYVVYSTVDGKGSEELPWVASTGWPGSHPTIDAEGVYKEWTYVTVNGSNYLFNVQKKQSVVADGGETSVAFANKGTAFELISGTDGVSNIKYGGSYLASAASWQGDHPVRKTGLDNGAKFYIEKVNANIEDALKSEFENRVKYGTADEWKTAQKAVLGYVGGYAKSTETSIDAITDFAGIEAFIAANEKIEAQDGGYYFVVTANGQNAQKGRYMSYSGTDCYVYELAAGVKPGVEHVWQFNAPSDGGFKLMSCNLGKYLKTGTAPAASTIVDVMDQGYKYTLTVNDFAEITIKDGNNKVLRTESLSNGKASVNQWTQGSTNMNTDATWYIIPAESIDVTLTATDASGAWATTYLPFGVDMPTGLEAYAVTAAAAPAGSENGTATLTKVTSVPANEGVILKATAAGTHTLTINKDASWTVTDNKLAGVNAGAAVNEAAYILAKVDEVIGLHTVELADGAWTSKANKAYLLASVFTAGAPFLMFDFGNTDAIKGIEAEKNNGAIYDLSGRRVKAATKGIFIINGKKVIK